MSKQIQVKVRPRPKSAEPADPPTISKRIARIWFGGAQ